MQPRAALFHASGQAPLRGWSAERDGDGIDFDGIRHRGEDSVGTDQSEEDPAPDLSASRLPPILNPVFFAFSSF